MEDDDNLEAEVDLLLGGSSNSSSATRPDQSSGASGRGVIRNLASRSASAESPETEEVDLAGLLVQTDNLLKMYEKQRDSLKKR